MVELNETKPVCCSNITKYTAGNPDTETQLYSATQVPTDELCLEVS